MQIHDDLIQGSPEWLAYRATKFNASDAPAMMGASSYTTRTELLTRMKTGLTAEVDAGTQRRFDDGHRFEALARPLAEKIIGQDLYPVTGSDGKYSASFDGLTMLEDIAFEHKSLNDTLRSAMFEGCTGDNLPIEYRIQMEQQCFVSGAGRVLFMASKWIGDELVEERHCWYESNDKLAQEIKQGWAQFEQDLAEHQPEQVATPLPIGKAPDALPALRIEVTGMVTASNLDAFKQHALSVFAGINKELSTDQDFANAEKTVKWCGEVETRLVAAKEHALSQTASIDELFKAIDDISAEARRVRLELDKLVKARKEAIRGEIVAEGVAKFAQHFRELNERIGKPLMPSCQPDFNGAIKGKRTVKSLRDAVNTELARVKIETSAIADKITINLRILSEHDDVSFLFSDLNSLVHKDAEDLRAVIKSRISEHEQKESARIQAEVNRELAAKEAAQLKAQQAEQAKPEAETVKKEKPSKAAAEVEKPSDEAIIQAVANVFGITYATAIRWIVDLKI